MPKIYYLCTYSSNKIDMDNLYFAEPYSLGHIIKEVASHIKEHGFSNEDYCLYSKEYSFQPDQICYIAEYPEVVDDEDVYPLFVVENNLELFYYGEQFENVLFNVMDQKQDPSENDFLKALDFYMENDTFIEF